MTTDGDIISDPVKVIVKAPIEVESVTIEGDFDDLLIGESTTLSAVVEPKNAENAAVSWSSNDEEVLTVDSNGKVTAVGGGSAEITASTPNGKEDTCEIYVDASSRRMKVRVNYSRDDDNNIGHEWSHSFRINGEPVEKEMLISEGDTLKFYSEIGVTLNVYTHLGLEDAAAEMTRMEEVEAARKEQNKISGVEEEKETVKRSMFRVV